MPRDQQADLPQLPLSAEQEQHIQELVLKEKHSGTVVRKDLINWFAGRILRRDGSKADITPHFADDFLDRHPDLAQKLVAPPHPRPEPPAPEDKTPKRGLALLRQMRRQDQTKALFGDSPPPPREHADFPDGDIIYHCLNRYVVRHGDAVTKYNTGSDGLDGGDEPNEALALRFVKEHTTIPVPAVLGSAWDRVTMEYVEGQTLQQAWPLLTPDERSGILAQLRGYIAQLRALGGIYLGRLDGRGVIVPSILTRSGGPFRTLGELHDWLVNPPIRIREESMYWHQITTQLGDAYPIVFTHGDIASRNIMIRDGRIVAILDWEFAGWYPAYWEYTFTLRGLDNIDWETIGQRIPLLFEKRYDLEYILVFFILRIS